MEILFFKALHIFGFVAWFGGLFYLVRIFVYHAEAFEKPEAEQRVLIPQYQLMENRVYKIICAPALIITWSCGIIMICIYGMDWFAIQYWLHLKIVLLIGLTYYHWLCKKNISALAKQKKPMSSFQYRLFNEIPTLFLLAISLLAVYKNIANFVYIFIAVFVFGVVLFIIAKAYKNRRQKKSN